MNATLARANDANRQRLPLLEMPERSAPRERAQPLMSILDELNEKMGKGAVLLGVPPAYS